MSEEKNPILNNPYEEPKFHYDTDMEGNLNYEMVLEGRRPFTIEVSINPKKKTGQQSLFNGSDFEPDKSLQAKFINDIRAEVGRWRADGYPRVTRVTKTLLDDWFNNPERPYTSRLFFCQREAVETAVYLNEVADTDPNMGRAILRKLDEALSTISENPDDVLPRTAFKMATGTGKTVVMAMLILYNYFNKKIYPQDTRFADHFLLVAPGITIRDRLGVLYVDSNTDRNKLEDYYHKRGLVPREFEQFLGGINEVITITNYHTFEPKILSGKKAGARDGKIGGNDGKEDVANTMSRLLGRNMKSKRFVVINDEAHHCYLPFKSQEKFDDREEAEESKNDNDAAMMWYGGLRNLKRLGYKIQHVYDLSATPYYLKGSGHESYSLFPWVVSDFGLVDAIESGLVKIPFLPKWDNSQDLTEPKLKNIYEHIKKDLPRKGQRTTKKEAKEKGEGPIEEVAPHLPALLTNALQQFSKDYEEYEKGLRTKGEAGVDLFTSPPVFIVVCNNTTVSKEVFKFLAGWRSKALNGEMIFHKGAFPIFSNYDENGPVEKMPSLLIDSEALDSSGNLINDDFRNNYRKEYEEFAREYVKKNGYVEFNKIPTSEVLREIVNTVGVKSKLGEHIRCVVSVSMLTEGWDANTVTHVCGVRAFGSQLLCEQVAGRALRRMHYDLKPYDEVTGEVITDAKRLSKINDSLKKHGKLKGVVYKFPPEYAHIIGVPFKNFKGGKTPPPTPPGEKTKIYALKEREHFEIVFPNVEGYRSENEEGSIDYDFNGLPNFRLNFNEIPTETGLGNALDDKEVLLKSNYQDIRDHYVIFRLTKNLINMFFNTVDKEEDNMTGRQFQKFGKLRDVVEYWYYNKLEIVGGDGSPELRRLVIFWDEKQTSNAIYDGIRNYNIGREKITAILNYYNPEGSTEHVWGFTSKPVYATAKSHVNYVVADTDTWEQLSAKALEEIDQVRCYVKNHFLDFKIPYSGFDGKEHYYLPDFIAQLPDPENPDDISKCRYLIIEISGFANDITANKDIKRHFVNDYWVPAVNNLGKYGIWDFIEITDIQNVKSLIIDKINQIWTTR